MPIYEYHCENCMRRVSILVQGFDSAQSPVCPQCGSQKLTRRFSSFSIGKGDTYFRKGLYEDILSDRELVRGLESNDPRALAKWNRQMSQASGENVGAEYEDMLGKLESGEPIHKVMAEQKAMMGDTGSGEE